MIWNRLSSGSYFPPPVKGVPIPKKSGGERLLGVPTVSDRIAQTVVKIELEPYLMKTLMGIVQENLRMMLLQSQGQDAGSMIGL
jgi:hypothetical protein